jgi:hypothetical protein
MFGIEKLTKLCRRFVYKKRTFIVELGVASSFITNIKISLKWKQVTNAVAYYAVESIS